jgi:lysophospholipase L1-like esterase
MKKLPSFLFVATLLAGPLAYSQAPAAPVAPAKPAAPPAATPLPLPPQPTDIAAPKMDAKTGERQAAFMAAHERFLTIAKEGKAQVVFLGDSITAGWSGAGKEVWAKAFGAYEPANFGIGGDRTQHVLWRITNGELDGLKPKAMVIMIGTNNVSSASAEEIAKGVTKIVETVRTKLPQTKILLLAVFPRGEKPDGKLGAFNEKIKQVNRIIAKLDDKKHVHFLDIGPKFTQGKDALNKEIMPDFLHLSPAGYQIWADAITPKLAELMK